MSRVALVGCGKAKRMRPAEARDLYTGTLFKLARRYAELRCGAWFILSAEHGLVPPTRPLAPYDTSMGMLTPDELRAWQVRTGAAIRDHISAQTTIVFLAGSDYEGALLGLPHSIERPLHGLSIGKRLAWFKKEVTRR